MKYLYYLVLILYAGAVYAQPAPKDISKAGNTPGKSADSTKQAAKALPADTAKPAVAVPAPVADTGAASLKTITDTAAAAAAVDSAKPPADSSQTAAKAVDTVSEPPAPIEEEKISVFGGGAPDYRSPRKAMFYSLLVPGLGQYYARSKLKAALFVAIEAGSFGAMYAFNKRGDDNYAVFTRYVDAHYSSQGYLDWYAYVSSSGIDTTEYLAHDSAFYDAESKARSQQYYEMVMKYRQFVFGWDDVQPTLIALRDGAKGDSLTLVNGRPVVKSDDYHVSIYNSERDLYDTTYGYSANQIAAAKLSEAANTEYRRATNMWFLVLANHICSGVDAALTARRYNRSQLEHTKISILDRLHVENRVAYGSAGPFPVITLKIDL